MLTKLQHLHSHDNGAMDDTHQDDAGQVWTESDDTGLPPAFDASSITSFAYPDIGPATASAFPTPDGALATVSDAGAFLDAAVGTSGAVPVQVQQALDATGLSFTGAGIKVGVLSDSFDNLGGAAADEASGALPASVTVLEDLASGGTDEGRAMLQIVHDVAPGASLAFYTAFNSEQDFANGILALAAAGCKVICDDVGYFDEPFFQNGIVAQAIETVEQEGVVYVTAAGNEASNAYQAAWTPIANTSYDHVALHDTESFGGSPVQTITVGANSTYSVPLLLEWNQPYGAATSNLEILVFQNGKLVGTATNSDVGEPNNPWTGIELTGGATYQIAIENLSGPDPGLIKEIAAGDGIPVTISGANTGTVFGHAMSPDAITVGAVSAAATPAFGANPPISEYFSSSGAGTELLFDDNGNALASPDLLNPVAVSSVDDVNTTVSGGLGDFYGTSAATPGVAAVAALMLQANSALNPTDVENLLEDSAISMSGSTTSNYSAVAGYGLIQANLAVQYAATDTIALNASHGMIAGTHLADTFVGGPGNHVINGDGGADTLNYANAPGPVSVDLSAGTTGAGLNGYGGTDTFTGIADVIGSAGNDTLTSSLTTIDSLDGGGGNDVFVVYQSDDAVSEPNGGSGTVFAYADYVLPANVDTLLLAGTATHGTGNSDPGGDGLYANQNLVSTLTGNTPDDVFVVYHESDVVVPKAGSHDVVYAAASYTLPGGVDALFLEGAATQGVGNSDAAGDALWAANPSQAATLIGNSANDTFVVYDSADVVVPKAGSHDVVYAAVDYTLPTGIDALILEGTATQGIGNSDTSGDALYAANPNVAATLIGNSHNDTFAIYNSNDVVTAAAHSHDTVYAAANYTLPTGVDSLILEGTATQGIGNSDVAGDTLVAGNPSVAATLIGHSADDTFAVYNSADRVVGQAGSADTVYAAANYILPTNVDTLFLEGNASQGRANNDAHGDALYANAAVASTLVGGTANDTLNVTGTAGATLSGGGGGNTFVFPAYFGSDAITDFKTSGGGADVIQFSSADFTSFDTAGDPHSVMANAVQSGADVVISNPTHSGDSVTLIGHVLADLVSTDFHLV